MHSPSPLPSSELTDCLFDLTPFGSITLSDQANELHFQIDLVPADCPEQVLFGLVQLDPLSNQPIAGFAIQLDWTAGQVRDALNGFGILDALDLSPMALQQHDLEDPLLLSLKVERHGSNLFPTFEIGGTRLLYPSILSTAETPFTALAGTAQPGADTAPFCLYPALWSVTPPTRP
jgi:hypothetical protein